MITSLSTKLCSNTLISDQNFTFSGGLVAGLMRNKANLSKAELAADSLSLAIRSNYVKL